ncbi:MAG: T9SS type A sorting domain-containing protein [Bacteroidota bacterium]
MKKIYFVLALVLVSFMARATSDTLAFYPLTVDGNDQMGLNSPMTLTSAPFQNGGVYCNGNASGYTVLTPNILNFSFSSFAVSFDFKVEEYLTQCVIVCGTSYRWLGFYLQADHTLEMKYNNANYVTSTATYQTGQWYNGRLTYDGTTARMILNGIEIANITIPLVYIATDTQFGTRDYSTANCLKGYIKNLVISNNYASGIKEVQSTQLSYYPNPANDFLMVTGADNNAKINIFDVSGRLLISKNNDNTPIDISSINEGVYFVRIENKNQTFTGKFIRSAK